MFQVAGARLPKRRSQRRATVLRSSAQEGITKPVIRRLARRGNVRRVSSLVYDETRTVVKELLEQLIRDAAAYAERAQPGRKVV